MTSTPPPLTKPAPIPTPLMDWPDDQVEQFRTLYQKWARESPEIAKTGLSRVALIYRRVLEDALVPSSHVAELAGYVEENARLREELAETIHRLENAETSLNVLSALRDKDRQNGSIHCPRCGGAMQVIEYTNRRRGPIRELRCVNRHRHHQIAPLTRTA